MFIYIGNSGTGYTHRFAVKNNMIDHIVDLYEKGYIIDDMIKVRHKSIDVLCYNTNNFKFVPGESYHLYLVPYADSVNIDLFFNKNSYVASRYRPINTMDLDGTYIKLNLKKSDVHIEDYYQDKKYNDMCDKALFQKFRKLAIQNKKENDSESDEEESA